MAHKGSDVSGLTLVRPTSYTHRNSNRVLSKVFEPEKMESDLGKLFIGGISWDTDEERFKEYFRRYGEVAEAVIMRDRATGRARGFGFIIFADPSVAERVILEKHVIDGRTVEAKKAVPKEDQQVLSRSIGSSIQGSPGQGRTKKIFVGGLASTVTEGNFKRYFDQFGTITDVVVMYDHNTQRPRGFGFITFDSEEAVDRVLHKSFHELCGKMVEVKRAVPKELSPGPNRSTLAGYNYGLNKANSLLNNGGFVGGFGIRIDKFSPKTNLRSGFSKFGTASYGIGLNSDPGSSLSYGRNTISVNIGNGQAMNSNYNGSPGRYTTPIGFNVGTGRNDTLLNSTARNLLGSGALTGLLNSFVSIPDCAILGSENGSFGGTFGNNGQNWSIRYGNREKNFGFGHRRNRLPGTIPNSQFSAAAAGYDASFGDLYNGSSVYGGSNWETGTHDVETSGYDLGNITSDVWANGLENFIGNYSVSSRQSSRGIAA